MTVSIKTLYLSEIPGANTVSDAFIALSMFTYVHKTVS